MTYILYTIWQMPFYIYGLVVSASRTLAFPSNPYLAGTARFRIHFPTIIVAGPTLILRAFPSPAYRPRRHVFRGSVVPPPEPITAARPPGHCHPLGS